MTHEPGYRFCPVCGQALASRCVKPGDPDRLCCTGCEYIFYLNPKLAAGVIAQQNGHLLLLRRAIEPAYGTWAFPGGFVDRGEHPEQAAVREAREEAGVEVRLDGMVGIYSYPPGSPVVLVVYRGTVIGGEFRALDESLEAELYHPAELPWPELAFSTTRLAFADYIRQLGIVPPQEHLPK